MSRPPALCLVEIGGHCFCAAGPRHPLEDVPSEVLCPVGPVGGLLDVSPGQADRKRHRCYNRGQRGRVVGGGPLRGGTFFPLGQGVEQGLPRWRHRRKSPQKEIAAPTAPVQTPEGGTAGCGRAVVGTGQRWQGCQGRRRVVPVSEVPGLQPVGRAELVKVCQPAGR